MSVLTLPDEIFSIEQISLVLNEIDQVLEQLKKKSTFNKSLSSWCSQVIAENNVDINNIDHLEDLRKFISKLLTDSPCLSIRTAQNISETMQMRINDWVKNNISRNILLSFKPDRTLYAGVVIQTPKSRFDYSLASGLEAGREYLISEVANAN